MTLIRIFLALTFVCWYAAVPVHADSAEDAYLRGYVEATLRYRFDDPELRVTVVDGVVRLKGTLQSPQRNAELKRVLDEIDGIEQVVWLDEASVHAVASVHEDSRLFPYKALFEPLIADPRWPHSAAAYRFYTDDRQLHAAGADIGGSFPIYGSTVFEDWQWQVGLQAAVFNIFDLGASSMDLINSDFWVALPLSVRHKHFSGQARLFHQSSHLGDEFLLNNTVERLNLSYEGVDVKASWDIAEWGRVYTGGGFLLRREPLDLDRWSALYGFELFSPVSFWDDRLTPVAGAHFTQREAEGWDLGASVRAGVELRKFKGLSRKVYLLLEYFKGRSPDGQFYDQTIEYWGLGTHFYF